MMDNHSAVLPSITSSSALIRPIRVSSTSCQRSTTTTTTTTTNSNSNSNSYKLFSNEILPTPSLLALSAIPSLDSSRSSQSPSPSLSSSPSLSQIAQLPSDNTVVIGKGKVPRKATGNLKLKALVRSKLQDYTNAKSKMVKTSIVSNIYDTIVKSCCCALQSSDAAVAVHSSESKSTKSTESSNDAKITKSPPFMRYNGKIYLSVSVSVARKMITSTFRDCLSSKYKSSSKNKAAKRRQANKEKQFQAPMKLHTQSLSRAITFDINHLANNNIKTNAMSTADGATTASPPILSTSQYYLPRIEPFNNEPVMYQFLGPIDTSMFDPIPLPALDCASTSSAPDISM